MKPDDYDQHRRFERYLELIDAIYDAAQEAVFRGDVPVVVTPEIEACTVRLRQLLGDRRHDLRELRRETLPKDGDLEEWEAEAMLRMSVLAAMLCNTVGEA
jgi:hypothetical protein